MRYKILGFINLALGLLQSGLPLVYYFIVVPKLMRVYLDFGTRTPPDLNLTYRLLLIILLLGLVNLLCALATLFFPRKLTFWLGVTVAGISLLVFGSYLGLVTFSVLLPIYSLTSKF